MAVFSALRLSGARRACAYDFSDAAHNRASNTAMPLGLPRLEFRQFP
jgi:hypothetical protein